MAVDLIQQVDTAIYTRLSGDATLTAMLANPTNIHNTEAPHDNDSTNTDFPVLVFQALDSTDEYVLTGLATEGVPYEFRAATQGSDNGPVHAILDRVYELLQDYALPVTGYRTLYLRRQSRRPVIPVTEYGVSYRQGSHRYNAEFAPS